MFEPGLPPRNPRPEALSQFFSQAKFSDAILVSISEASRKEPRRCCAHGYERLSGLIEVRAHWRDDVLIASIQEPHNQGGTRPIGLWPRNVEENRHSFFGAEVWFRHLFQDTITSTLSLTRCRDFLKISGLAGTRSVSRWGEGKVRPMSISFVCPACGKRLRAPDQAVGHQLACPACDGVVAVPVRVGSMEPDSAGKACSTALKQAQMASGILPALPVAAVDGAMEVVLHEDRSESEGLRKRNCLASVPRRVRLSGLGAASFQHPLDRQATDALKALKGFDWLVGKFMEYGIERFAYVRNLSSNIRVGPRQLSKVHDMLIESCEILDLPEPELYVSQGPVNAYTYGHNNPYIVLYTDLLDVMNDDEVMAVIAHELGHVKCGHVLYWQMAGIIGPLLQRISETVGMMTLGVGEIVGAAVGAGIMRTFMTWKRRAELSADRAALLVMQDARPCVSMMMKLAGGSRRWSEQLDPEEFLIQARAYTDGLDQSKLDRLYRFLEHQDDTHPVPVERAHVLAQWVGSQEYADIISGRFAKTSLRTTGEGCRTCETLNEAGAKFCSRCGRPLCAIQTTSPVPSGDHRPCQ